ncbi:MAG: DUF2061 domain-containing protein [Bacteroidetes bacterium]|nr:DUF2061 domain-containing protein [Bacteroidales bacterium]NJO68314.1 DUF2061 domain-containing protein [Bacteroidota bacterium]
MMEQKRRSIVKAITWRITGTVDTFLLAWIITGKFEVAITLSSVEVITKMLLYYLHERTWTRISFGKVKPQKDDYVI